MDYKIQAANSSKYKERGYMSPRRWSSYAIQIREAMLMKPERILEIGPGNGIVSNVLKNMGFDVQTLDFDNRLGADYIASITDEKFAKSMEGKFDVIIACQVLEHIRYEDFPKALRNMRMMASSVILSLPHTELYSRIFHLTLKIPGIRKFSNTWKLIYKPVKHEFNGEHYWDMGTIGFPVRKIKRDIRAAGWRIEKNFLNPDNPYHYFFILKNENQH